MVPLSRWNDDRLDDLQEQVKRMREPVESVSVLRAEMRSLARSLDALRGDLDEYFGRRHSWRVTLIAGAISAMAGGVVGSLIIILGGH